MTQRPVRTAMIRARSLMGFSEMVSACGGDPLRMLKTCGIDPGTLTNPENALSLSSVAMLIEHAANELAMPDFGLRMSSYRDLSVIGPAAIMVANSATLGDALTTLSKTIRYNNPDATITIDGDSIPGQCCYRHDIHIDDDLPQRHMIEGTYRLFCKYLCLTSRSDGKTWQVNFRHKKGLTAKAYSKYFPCKVTLGRSHDEIIFPVALLDIPLTQADPALRAMAERYLQNVQRRYPLDMHRQVAEIIERLLADGDSNIVRVASLMGVHHRTLQRRLKAQGVSFDEVIDDIRRRRAIEFLSYPAIPLAEVSLLCGYSGQTAFNVACRRWFNTTPRQYRIQCLLGGSATTP